MPELKPVQSSNVHSIGYDAETLELDVRFKDKEGKPSPNVYRHQAVPAEKATALMAADSIGGFYAKNIRGKFDNKPIPA